MTQNFIIIEMNLLLGVCIKPTNSTNRPKPTRQVGFCELG